MQPPLAASSFQVFALFWGLLFFMNCIDSPPCVLNSFYLDASNIFSLSFNSLIITFLGKVLVLFVLKAYWILMSFIKFGSFSHYLFKYFSIPGSSYSKTVFRYMLICMMSHRSLGCWSHFFSINFFLCFKWWFFSLTVDFHCWVPLNKFHFCYTFLSGFFIGYFLILFDWHSEFIMPFLCLLAWLRHHPWTFRNKCFAVFWTSSYIGSLFFSCTRATICFCKCQYCLVEYCAFYIMYGSNSGVTLPMCLVIIGVGFCLFGDLPRPSIKSVSHNRHRDWCCS